MTTTTPAPATTTPHPAWLPTAALRPVGRRRLLVLAGDGPVADTVRREAADATAAHGGAVAGTGEPADVVLATAAGLAGLPSGDAEAADPVAEALVAARDAADDAALAAEGFLVVRRDGVTAVLAADATGLLHGWHHLVRTGETAFAATDAPVERHEPTQPIRMLDHWDNIAADSPMGAVERGYAGASHGCVNVRNMGSLAALFAQVRVGDTVVVHRS